MQILVWNIRHGGGSRAQEIAAYVRASGTDAVVLPECRDTGPSRFIRESISEVFPHQAFTSPTSRTNSVLLASRQSFREQRFTSLEENGYRVLCGAFEGFMLVAVYFPAVGARIRPIFQRLLEIAGHLVDTKALIVGDFNTGINGADNASGRFTCSDEMTDLCQQGWVDVWRLRHLEKREFSWYSVAGNGFRIDHAFANPKLAKSVQSARYDHKVRTKGLSDHSSLWVEVCSECIAH